MAPEDAHLDESEAMTTLETLVAELSTQLDELSRSPRRDSRFVGQSAEPGFAEQVAAGASVKTVANEALAAAPLVGNSLAGVMTKALAEGTGSAGGFLVPVEIAGEVLTMLRARSTVLRMGARVVPVEKELDLVSLSAGASANYVAENARVPVSEQTFAQASLLRPKALAALVPVSRRLLRDAANNPSVEAIVREDLSEVLALRADLAFLRGTGAAEEPLGIRNTVGLTSAPSLGTNGRAPTYDDLKDMVANLRAANAPFERPGWIFNPRTLNTLEKLKDAQGHYLAEAGLLTFDPTGGGGTLLGFPFRTTTQIPINLTTGSSSDTSEITFSSDWGEAWIGENEDLEIALSAEASYSADGTTWHSAFQQQQVLFRATWFHDIGLRRPVLFSVMAGVRP